MSVLHPPPCVSAQASRPRPSDESAQASRGVLIVDDEETIRSFLRIVVEQQKRPLWLARSGVEAVAIYREHGQEIAVVLLDVRMPGLDGPQTLAKLKELNHELACCFMSANCDPYTREELLSFGAVDLVEKPFCLDALTQMFADGWSDS